VLSGPEHRFTMVNEAYRTLVAARDVVGRTVAEALPEVVEQGFVRLLDQVYASGEPHIGRGAPVHLQHGPDGVLTELYLDFIYQPIVAGDGVTSGIFIQGHDVTEQHETEKAILAEVAERRRAEEALQVLNNTLEQRVHDEVHARSKVEEQLRQVHKMEAVGQLTGGIAHDFNNMLAVIMGGLNLVQRKLARGETDVDRFIEGAIDGAQRAATLTQRLLAFSRQQALSPEPLVINKLVAGMSELLIRTLGEQVKVETVLAAGLWQVRADPAQLENAILNLAVNARDAMPGGGRLTIETMNAFVDDAYAQEYAIEAGQYVLIAVADTGAGMAPEVIAKAFDPFFTTKGAGKGTGLGLSQVYGFVRQSGGHVKIYSELGVGTSVKIYLPRLYGEAAATEQAKRLATVHRGLRSEIILVVEDEERVRALSVEALRELGYGVVEASGPSLALRMLDEGQQVTLLFTDVVMPDMSGRQLADRARGKRPNLKVLYTTGYTRNAIVHNGMLDPGTNLLTKPFSIEELAGKIRKILDEEA
jgi:signal transduction histidine kinase/CheY-like chemotaxis protein